MASHAGRKVMRPIRPLPSHAVFRRRLARGMAISGGAIAIGLAIGAVGYHTTEGLSWLDATVNAAMLLAGEGPLAPLRSDAGKVFATVYALFSGVVFITAVSVLLAPVVHRFLHHMHLEIATDAKDDQ